MRNVLFVHGVGGDGTENWFFWLRHELEKLGCKVTIPKFPTPENQTLTSWLAVLEKYSDAITPDCLMVGHSLGVAFLLNVLEKHKAKAAFLVAGVSGPLNNEFDPTMTTFSHRQFDWQAIKKNCGKFYVYHSDNDPYIPLADAQKLCANLTTELSLIPGAGHINESAGYTKFPLLLEQMKREL